MRQSGDGAVRVREIAVGESWIDGPTTYRLSDIQFEPPQVILECSTDGREAEQRVLVPVARADRPITERATAPSVVTAGRVVAAEHETK